MKLCLVVLLIIPSLVSSYFLSSEKRELKKHKTSEMILSDFMFDWNLKHSGSNLIVVMNIGKSSEMTDNVLKMIPKKFSAVVLSTSHCQSLGQVKAEFVIVISAVYDFVSIKKSLSFYLEKLFATVFRLKKKI
jgi:hypothetical protein